MRLGVSASSPGMSAHLIQYDPEAALRTLWTTLRKLEIGGYDPDAAAAAAAAATEWQPTTLSNLDGLDGLDNADPDEIDDVHLTPVEA